MRLTTASSGLTVVVDRNELQSDKPTEEILALGNLEAKLARVRLARRVLRRPRLRRAAARVRGARARSTDRPQALVARTIKGRGVSFMEHPAALREDGGTYRWHAGAPDDESFERARDELLARIEGFRWSSSLSPRAVEDELPAPALEARARERCGDTRHGQPRVRRRGLRPGARRAGRAESATLVVLDADLASDCRVRGFEEAYPERFLECGIAEQDMVSVAGGLARHGLLPVVNSFASFLASRANEQIYNNASEGSKVDLRPALRRIDPRRAGHVASEPPRRLAARRPPEHDHRAARECRRDEGGRRVGRRGGGGQRRHPARHRARRRGASSSPPATG